MYDGPHAISNKVSGIWISMPLFNFFFFLASALKVRVEISLQISNYLNK